MRPRISAGLALYRLRDGRLEVLLAHPGGPFFAHKDDGHWTIPKGEIEPGEDLLATAIREVREEVGIAVDPASRFLELGSIRQKGGKIVHAWAAACDWDESQGVRSNTCEMEWPPGSGRVARFPEVDRACFFSVDEARQKIKETQVPLLDALERSLGLGGR
jgi:predicted NUDIX family NTP pyrophosphohydrolase